MLGVWVLFYTAVHDNDEKHLSQALVIKALDI